MTAVHWTDENIKQGILRVAKDLNLSRMPSHSEVNAHTGNRGLSSAVSKRNGGWEALSRELNLPMKECESYFASRYESAAAELLNRHGFQAERMTANFPYPQQIRHAEKADRHRRNTNQILPLPRQMGVRKPLLRFLRRSGVKGEI